MSRQPLHVWLYGMRVGELTPNRSRKSVRFEYSEEALDTYQAGIPLLSCSLPVRSGAHDATGFFSGLLPEGHHLLAVAAKAGVPPHDVHGILTEFGADVVGALVVTRTPEQPEPTRAPLKPLSASQLSDAVGSLSERPLGLDAPGFGSPLSGFQDKIALVRTGEDSFALPAKGHPSTHILKREDSRLPGGAEAEAECLRLAKVAGLTTVTPEIRSYAGYRCLIVDRFDRALSRAEVRRIHQEDACQAAGLDPAPTEGGVKYEQHGGPSFAFVARMLTHHATDRADELTKLAGAAAYTAAIGNADAHGKNIAFVHTAPGEISLAPLYDTVPTMLWPKVIHDQLSMRINGKTGLNDVGFEDLVAEASSWGLDAKTAADTIKETLDTLTFHAVGDTATDRLVRQRVARLSATRPTTC